MGFTVKDYIDATTYNRDVGYRNRSSGVTRLGRPCKVWAMSAIVGAASGYLPARRAAGLDPVDALPAE